MKIASLLSRFSFFLSLFHSFSSFHFISFYSFVIIESNRFHNWFGCFGCCYIFFLSPHYHFDAKANAWNFKCLIFFFKEFEIKFPLSDQFRIERSRRREKKKFQVRKKKFNWNIIIDVRVRNWSHLYVFVCKEFSIDAAWSVVAIFFFVKYVNKFRLFCFIWINIEEKKNSFFPFVSRYFFLKKRVQELAVLVSFLSRTSKIKNYTYKNTK